MEEGKIEKLEESLKQKESEVKKLKDALAKAKIPKAKH